MENTEIPSDSLSDLEAVLQHAFAGTVIAPQVAQRVRERSETIQEELRRKYGQLNIAVDLIREIRDEE